MTNTEASLSSGTAVLISCSAAGSERAPWTELLSSKIWKDLSRSSSPPSSSSLRLLPQLGTAFHSLFFISLSFQSALGAFLPSPITFLYLHPYFGLHLSTSTEVLTAHQVGCSLSETCSPNITCRSYKLASVISSLWNSSIPLKAPLPTDMQAPFNFLMIIRGIS